MGPIGSEICCRSAEASEPRTYYLNGTIDNAIVLTWIDLLKSGEPFTMSSGTTDGIDMSDVSNNSSSNSNSNSNNQSLAAGSNLTLTLTDMFNSKSAYVNISTEMNPLGEIRGQVMNALLLP
jgi:hypothetical protein